MKIIATLLMVCCLFSETASSHSLLPLPAQITYTYDTSSSQNTDDTDTSQDTNNTDSSQNTDDTDTSQDTNNTDSNQNTDDTDISQNTDDSDTPSGTSGSDTETTAQTTQDSQTNENQNSALSLETPSAILIEASTGTVIFEKDSHKQMRPASITKIMTLILIFEAIEKGQFSLTDTVTVSEHAASMGGSQVYLEPGEEQTVQDLIKCISIASANDASVAMAEFVAGSEDAFVNLMNKKADDLGMKDTNFVNCCGLEADNHLTSAYDISLMARELSVRHPEIFDYCTIWMDTITHHTAKGDSEFGLTNTNKLIRYYSYATGLKTGYTSQSKYCLAATATRDDVDLIAVVMAEPSPTVRNKEAIALLDYGFATCHVYADANEEALPTLPVKKGTSEFVELDYKNNFSYVILDGSGTDSIEKSLEIPEELSAPIQAGQEVGAAVYRKDGEEIGRVPILATTEVSALTIKDCFLRYLNQFFSI